MQTDKDNNETPVNTIRTGTPEMGQYSRVRQTNPDCTTLKGQIQVRCLKKKQAGWAERGQRRDQTSKQTIQGPVQRQSLAGSRSWRQSSLGGLAGGSRLRLTRGRTIRQCPSGGLAGGRRWRRCPSGRLAGGQFFWWLAKKAELLWNEAGHS